MRNAPLHYLFHALNHLFAAIIYLPALAMNEFAELSAYYGEKIDQ